MNNGGQRRAGSLAGEGGRIHVAVASTESLPGRTEHNLAQIAGFARRAAEDKVHLLLTPELSACGYGSYPEVLDTTEEAGKGEISRRLSALSAETGVVLVAGFAECSGGEFPYLSQMAVFPDGRIVVQRKHNVTKTEKPFQPAPGGAHIRSFEVEGVRCGILICADAGLGERQQLLEAEGIDLVLLPSGAGGNRQDRVTVAELKTEEGKATYERVLKTVFCPDQFVAESLRDGRSRAAVNLVGYDGQKHYHCGHGCIINGLGEVVALAPGQPILDRQHSTYVKAWIDA